MSALHEELNPEGNKPPEWLRQAYGMGAVATVHSIKPEANEESTYNPRLARGALISFLELDADNPDHKSRLNSLSLMEDEDVIEQIDVLLGRWQDSIVQQDQRQQSEAMSDVFRDSLRGMSEPAIQIRHNLAVSTMVKENLDAVTEGIRNILNPGRVQLIENNQVETKPEAKKSKAEKPAKKVENLGSLIPEVEAMSAPLGMAIIQFAKGRKTMTLARQNALVYHLDVNSPDNRTNGDVEEALRTFAVAAQTLLGHDPQAFTPLEKEVVGRLTGKDLKTLRDPKMQLVLKQQIRSAANDMEDRLGAENSTISEVLEQVFVRLNEQTN